MSCRNEMLPPATATHCSFYRRVIRCTGTGSGAVSWPFYHDIHKFLGTLPANDATLVDDSLAQTVGAHHTAQQVECISMPPGIRATLVISVSQCP